MKKKVAIEKKIVRDWNRCNKKKRIKIKTDSDGMF